MRLRHICIIMGSVEKKEDKDSVSNHHHHTTFDFDSSSGLIINYYGSSVQVFIVLIHACSYSGLSLFFQNDKPQWRHYDLAIILHYFQPYIIILKTNKFSTNFCFRQRDHNIRYLLRLLSLSLSISISIYII